MKLMFLAAIIASVLTGCGKPKSQVEYVVSCDSCRVRYSVADTTGVIFVRQVWQLQWETIGHEAYGIHVDSVMGQHPAVVRVQQGEDTKYINSCFKNSTCDMSYVGVTDL
ncbi:MAG: hypothetical protein JNL05_00435 [Flavobacteriales bacterium]|nr:hypothetical protein [Flavobacteriales bacterium]